MIKLFCDNVEIFPPILVTEGSVEFVNYRAEVLTILQIEFS
jgi:hypothetical protein